MFDGYQLNRGEDGGQIVVVGVDVHGTPDHRPPHCFLTSLSPSNIPQKIIPCMP